MHYLGADAKRVSERGRPALPGPDGIPGIADDPGIPDQTSFFSGKMSRDELVAGVNASTEVKMGLPAP